MISRLLIVPLLIVAAPALAQFDQLNAPQLESERENAITPQLVVDTRANRGGKGELAILMKVKPGWHGYWLNPGDAGLPMSVEWDLPKGWSVGPLRYPVPTRLNASGIVNYVYEGDYALLASLNAPAGASGVTRIAADMRWLACTDEVCVPEEGRVELDVPAGGPALPDPRFAAWHAALPRALTQPATFERDGDRLRIAVPLPASVRLDDAYFFPATDGALDYDAPQQISRDGDLVIVEAKVGTDSPAQIAGVLASGGGEGWDVVAGAGRIASPDRSKLLFPAALFALIVAAGLFWRRSGKSRG